MIELAKRILDRSGFTYVGVDTVSRLAMWPAIYKTTKDAAIDFESGKISYKKFLNITNIDTMMKDAQYHTARDLLSSGDIRALSNYVADIYTFDIYRAYAEEERAGIERTRERRALVGIYVYVRGTFDEFYNRGFRPLFKGIKAGNVGRAKRGAANIAKGILGRRLADVIMVGLGLKAAYSLWKSMYTPLQPAVGITAETMTKIDMILEQKAQGNITEKEALKAMTEVIYRGMDDIIHVLPDIKKGNKNEKGERSNRSERQ